MNNLNTRQSGTIYAWALTADGKIIELYRSQSEALDAWRKMRKRRGVITDFAVEQVRGLFDG